MFVGKLNATIVCLLLFKSTEVRRSYLNWVSEARLTFITKLCCPNIRVVTGCLCKQTTRQTEQWNTD